MIRREKLVALRSLGIDPYPAALFPIDADSKSIRENFSEGKKVIIAGRLMSRRIQGKASFAELQDSNGRIQLYFNRDEICDGEDKTIYNQRTITGHSEVYAENCAENWVLGVIT